MQPENIPGEEASEDHTKLSKAIYIFQVQEAAKGMVINILNIE